MQMVPAENYIHEYVVEMRDDAPQRSISRVSLYSTKTYQVRPLSEKENLAGARSVISMTGNQTRIIDPAFFDSEDGSESPSDRSMW